MPLSSLAAGGAVVRSRWRRARPADDPRHGPPLRAQLALLDYDTRSRAALWSPWSRRAGALVPLPRPPPSARSLPPRSCSDAAICRCTSPSTSAPARRKASPTSRSSSRPTPSRPLALSTARPFRAGCSTSSRRSVAAREESLSHVRRRSRRTVSSAASSRPASRSAGELSTSTCVDFPCSLFSSLLIVDALELTHATTLTGRCRFVGCRRPPRHLQVRPPRPGGERPGRQGRLGRSAHARRDQALLRGCASPFRSPPRTELRVADSALSCRKTSTSQLSRDRVRARRPASSSRTSRTARPPPPSTRSSPRTVSFVASSFRPLGSSPSSSWTTPPRQQQHGARSSTSSSRAPSSTSRRRPRQSSRPRVGPLRGAIPPPGRPSPPRRRLQASSAHPPTAFRNLQQPPSSSRTSTSSPRRLASRRRSMRSRMSSSPGSRPRRTRLSLVGR